MYFKPGFRFSRLDALIIASALGGAWYLHQFSIELAMIVLFVVAHFFLFCNIVRMSRIPELIWAGVFAMLTYIALATGLFGWWLAAGLSVLLSALLVTLEIRKPSYHGMFWRRLNPELPEWFAANSIQNK